MSAIIVPAAHRHTMRRQVRVPCQVVSDQHFELLGESTLDLSLEGMKVLTRTHVNVGEKVIVSFKAPIGGLWFDAEGEVVRAVHGYRAQDQGREFALRFSYFERVSKTLLASRLCGFPPPLPKRRHRVDYAASVRRIFYRAPEMTGVAEI
ncbi:MAG: PilZ domain-containing protein [Myxococcales bacterium]|nr:PilZ domain-containing protein [Myxococcales bacterium]MCB9709532.1 PilZ domain-containing protein [Myxococcales bacterium]